MKVIDNFLPKDSLLSIQEKMFSEDFPWYLGKIVPTELLLCDTKENFQLWHGFYDGFMPISDHCLPLMNHFIEIIQPKALIKIKANLTLKTSTIIEHGYHVDLPHSNGFKTAVFYLNTNNGYTKFIDGSIVNSIENRFVEFDGNISHTGTTCTDSTFRAVINFNYV